MPGTCWIIGNMPALSGYNIS